jgi:hypothetical protein
MIICLAPLVQLAGQRLVNGRFDRVSQAQIGDPRLSRIRPQARKFVNRWCSSGYGRSPKRPLSGCCNLTADRGVVRLKLLSSLQTNA